MSNPTTRANAAQTAANAAATLFQGTGNVEGFGAALQRISDFIVNFGQILSDAEQAAARQATAQQTMAGATQQVQNQLGGQVVRDLSTEDARWQDALINNPGDWYNNVGDSRATSGGGKGPDFRFKNDDNVKSLFLNGQYGPAPAWVFEKLNLPFPGSQPQAAPAPAQNQAQTTPSGNPVPF